MNCREFELSLERLVEGNLAEGIRDEARCHVASCASCRELEGMARASAPAGEIAVHEGLTESVLERTSGPACGKAHQLLGDFVDAALEPADAGLVRAHLEHCRSCEAIAETLVWAGGELPGMAEIDPGARFTAAVLQATVGWRRRGFRARLRAWAAHLVWRPRFAMEAAYVGAVVLWLLFGAGFSPFRDLPARALELATFNPAPAMEASISSIPDLIVRPVSKGWQVWRAASSRMESAVEENRVLILTRSLGWNGLRMIGELLRGDLERSRTHLDGILSDLRAIWLELSQHENKAINLEEA